MLRTRLFGPAGAAGRTSPGPGDSQAPAAAPDFQGSGRGEIRWSLGWDWFFAVAALHTLVAVALGTLLSPWWMAACGASLALKTSRTRPGEAYLLLPLDEGIEVRRQGTVLRLAGACWMTRRWLVIPTTRRVLPLRRGRLSDQDFARLRRAARG